MSLRITSTQVSQAVNRALTAHPAAPDPTQVNAVNGVSRGNAVSAPSQVPAKKTSTKTKRRSSKRLSLLGLGIEVDILALPFEDSLNAITAKQK